MMKGWINMCTQSQALTILEEVYQQCSRRLPCKIEDAYLYGSYARGDYHAESDVDILLTVDGEDIAPLRKVAAGVSSFLSLKYDVTVSVSLKPAAHFLRYSDSMPFYQNVLREGIRYVC